MTTAKETKPDWQPEKVNEEGVHLTGKSALPANHRLRAEKLVEMRRRSDPDGIITDELIADTAARLKREAAAESAAKPAAESAAKPAAESAAKPAAVAE